MDGDNLTYVKTCVDCGTKTLVVDSREQANGSITRRRRCPKCGFEFWTIEIETCMCETSDLLDEIAELRKQNKKLKNQVEKAKEILDSILVV